MEASHGMSGFRQLNTMKILHVVPTLNPAAGGVIEAIIQMSREMIRMGHAVEIATLGDPAAGIGNTREFAVHALGPRTIRYYLYVPNLPAKLRTLASGFDAVVVHGLWLHHSWSTYIALRDGAVPYFVFPHGMLEREYPLKYAKKWLYWPFEHKVLSNATAVLFTCEEERRLARTCFRPYRVREEVTGLGTTEPPTCPRSQGDAFFTDFPMYKGKRILLFLGRLHPVKACDILVRAFIGVAKADPSAVLVLAGPDQVKWWPELLRLTVGTPAEGRVSWLGPLDAVARWGALRAADALVLVSHHENFGLVVAEALACGTPVLISNKVNIWREVSQDRAGYVSDDRLMPVTRMLEMWLTISEVERQELRERAVTCFRNRFTIERATKNFLALVQEVQSGR